ncbi:MAG TPA: tol-pal system-associated acyl-CoA thioesterase [Geminicoccaceae bacterium]|nr:tol-pal system-associated acyl-CoA thioesterase [Geminicoccaceae bacterium]
MSAITGGVHRLDVRVYYEDTDAAGIVYHANYLKFAERARTELLRLRGLDHPRLLAEHGVAFVVRHCAIDYRRAARLDDLLTVETTAGRFSGARILLRQAICRDGEPLVALDLTLALLGRDLRPRRVPAGLRDAFAGIEHGA